MAVYVDTMRAPFGRMIMCHMMADTTPELLEMADKIGLRPQWLQSGGTPKEHFDVSLTRKALALKYGAVEIDARGVVELIRRKQRWPLVDIGPLPGMPDLKAKT